MNAKSTVGTAAVLVLVFLGLGTIGSGSASLLSIKYPHKNPAVPAGSLIAVSGTSAPSNATHTNCNVAVQLNQHGYVRASPQGSKGVSDYTKWTAISTSRIQLGLNQIEAQLLCYPPGIASTPNLMKHLVHNVTGVQVVELPHKRTFTINTGDTCGTNAEKGTDGTRTTLDNTANAYPVAA